MLMWSTYAEYGFAKIDIVGGKVTNIRSELRGACTKTFRHRLGTILIDSMDFHKLSRNYVKSALVIVDFQRPKADMEITIVRSIK